MTLISDSPSKGTFNENLAFFGTLGQYSLNMIFCSTFCIARNYFCNPSQHYFRPANRSPSLNAENIKEKNSKTKVINKTLNG